MVLSEHVNADKLLSNLTEKGDEHAIRALIASHTLRDPYSSKYNSQEPIPKFRIPSEGCDEKQAYQLISDDLDLDGKPNLNLASFVNTYISDRAQKLAVENLTKNLADADEYPALMTVHARCVSILGHLWNNTDHEKAIGTATTGSSEAIHLGGLAMKKRWQEKRRAAGKSTEKPNILMAANAQVALEKFARYFDVEDRIIPVREASKHCLDLTKIKENLDENTIGIFVIMGSTYTGHYEDVKGVAKILDEYEKETGHSIDIHVDGASGAMVAPFLYPDLEWDFRIPRVKSINTSGHKFGLTTAGLGWILWRDAKYLPKDLIFELHYLGGKEESYTLNFSRPGFPVLHQYYNFLHLGFDGYKQLHASSMANARLLSVFLEATGHYTCVSEIHLPADGSKPKSGDVKHVATADPLSYMAGLPVVAFRFSDSFRETHPEVPQAAVSTLLRVKGYIIPNYELPPSEQKTEILRVVVRQSMSIDLLDRLMEDISAITNVLLEAVEDVKKLRAEGDHDPQLIHKYVLTLVTGKPIEEREEDWEGHSTFRSAC